MRKVKFIIFSLIFALAFCFPFLSFDQKDNFSYADEQTKTISSVDDWTDVYNNWNTYYSYNLVLNADLDFGNNSSISPLGTEERPFTGTFNGNGYTISNIQIYNDSASITSIKQYIGIFGYARNATIMNLKIAGNVAYTYSELNNNYSSILLGYGYGVNIENIEIDANFTNLDGEPYTFNFKYSEDFGVIAGALVNNSTVKNVISKTSLSFNLTQAVNNIYSVGGLVGSLTNSHLVFGINQGNIMFTRSETAGGTLNLGGLVGLTSQSNSTINNNIFDARITSNLTESVSGVKYGAITGSVTLFSDSSKGNISYNYFTNNISPFGDNGYAYDNISTRDYNNYTSLNSNNSSFYTTNVWSNKFEAWDFNTKWKIETSPINDIRLQAFLTFSFSLNNVLDIENNILETADGGNFSSTPYKWNTMASAKVKYLDGLSGFYDITSLLRNDIEIATISTRINEDGEINYLINYKDAFKIYSPYITLTHQTANDTISLELIVNNTTVGKYNFGTTATTYTNTISAQIDSSNGAYMGTVKRSSSTADGTTYFLEPMFYGTVYSYQASATGTYTFEQWRLYDEDDIEVEILDTLDNTSITTSRISFAFGTGNFVGNFKLVASFSNDPYYLIISYDNSAIEKVVVDEVEITNGESIGISKLANPEVKIYVKQNYTFDFDSFLANFKTQFYADQDKLPVKRLATEDPENPSLMLYSFQFRVSYLVPSDSSTLSFSISTEKKKVTSNPMFLYGGIAGGVVLLIVIAVVVIIVIKKKSGGGISKSGKGGGKSKSSSSYKKMYY